MEQIDIEDTDDWLGLPTPLESCKQHILLLENEVDDLNCQLRKARSDIFGLVQMNDQLADDKSRLAGELKNANTQIARLICEASEMLSRVGGLEHIRHQRDHLLRQLGLETDVMLRERLPKNTPDAAEPSRSQSTITAS